jgi:hypothetical protein
LTRERGIFYRRGGARSHPKTRLVAAASSLSLPAAFPIAEPGDEQP